MSGKRRGRRGVRRTDATKETAEAPATTARKIQHEKTAPTDGGRGSGKASKPSSCTII